MPASLGTLNVDTGSVLKDVTLNVRVAYRPATRFRVWLGTRLFHLAARVFGCHVNVEATHPSP